MGQPISENDLINAITNNELEIKIEYPVSEDDYSILDYFSKVIEKKLSGDNRTSRSVVAVAGTCTLVIFGVTVVIYIYTNMDVCIKVEEQIIDAASELGRSVLMAANDFINNTKIQLIKTEISDKLKKPNGDIDIDKFKRRVGKGADVGYQEDVTGQGWVIQKYRVGGNSHASEWKLKTKRQWEKGKSKERTATLNEDGKVLRD